MTRREMLARMSSQELTEWMVYESIEPFPAQRMSTEHAYDRMLFANANRDRKTKAFTVEDMMAYQEQRELTQEEIAEKVAAALGAPA